MHQVDFKEVAFVSSAGGPQRHLQCRDHTSRQNIASEVLPIAEEQLEQDVLPHQDDKTPVSSFEDDDTEELDKACSSQTPPHGDQPDGVPQIIKPLDWHDSTDHYIMVLERSMPCVNLFCFVKLHGGSLDEGMAQNVIRQVINAANVCCERGVFHCDIKLENLLINQDTMKVRCTYEGLCLDGLPCLIHSRLNLEEIEHLHE
ncbi:hypothetical protein G5714_003391 [Onychostoma macrolepis]|uniref:non-specific serine/threonine protein kinase n=1 Tax=Onychostoma macrolepis TaxID=369639 RepID=A0A7J6D9M2_9TELE|nr:hypothetical protein G5714_003391 [Onychostoma macrolepis]